jgi:hypothetical protein
MNFINRLLGRTFLLNLHTGEVHNLKNEKKNCGISLISRDHKKYVTKKKAMEMIATKNFNGCRWCMSKEDTDKW